MRVAGIWRALVCSATLASTGALAGSGQPPSGFSGQWGLESVSPERSGYEQFWLGTEARVAHDASGLTITRLSPAPQREAKFRFDVAENRNEYVVNGQPVVRISRATSSAGALLISTDTLDKDGQRWLSNILRWSFDANGALVVGDTEICGRGECPSVVTTVKFSRKP